MNTVYAIKDFELLAKVKKDLSEWSTQAERRKYLLLVCGIYLGLRISDLRKLSVGDILGDSVLRMKEKKTGKVHSFPIHEDLQRIIRKEFKGAAMDTLILESPYKKHGRVQAIGRKTAYVYINEIFKPYGIKYAIGAHTLRKTFGYMFYKMTGGDITQLMMWFNHSSIEVTKRYIGIDIDERASQIKKIKI